VELGNSGVISYEKARPNLEIDLSYPNAQLIDFSYSVCTSHPSHFSSAQRFFFFSIPLFTFWEQRSRTLSQFALEMGISLLWAVSYHKKMTMLKEE
jgi:hypothetical protein